MKYCEDCGDEVEGRRIKCKECNAYVCSWCFHHVHKLPMNRPTQDAQDGAKRPLTGRNGKPTNVLADGTVLPIAPPVI